MLLRTASDLKRPMSCNTSADGVFGRHISDRALRQWRQEPGFPDCANGYDIKAIKRWRNARAKKGSEAGDKMHQLKLDRESQRLRLDTHKADDAERQGKIGEGNILPRDELTLTLRELIGLARDRILNEVPREIAKRFPKHRRKIFAVCDTTIRGILEQLSRDLKQVAQHGNE